MFFFTATPKIQAEKLRRAREKHDCRVLSCVDQIDVQVLVSYYHIMISRYALSPLAFLVVPYLFLWKTGRKGDMEQEVVEKEKEEEEVWSLLAAEAAEDL